jgi:hypothetical protein
MIRMFFTYSDISYESADPLFRITDLDPGGHLIRVRIHQIRNPYRILHNCFPNNEYLFHFNTYQ